MEYVNFTKKSTWMLLFATTATTVGHIGARFVVCLYGRMTKVDETLYWLSIFSDWPKRRGAESYHPMFWELHFEPSGRMHWNQYRSDCGLNIRLMM